MRNIWFELGRDGSAPSGPWFIADMFRGFHPRLFMLFASGEPVARAGISAFADGLAFSMRPVRPSSARRMNTNSRGCQPTELRNETNSTLKGSNHEMPFHTWRTNSRCHRMVRPLQGRAYLCMRSVSFTHGYSCCSPSVNLTGVALRRKRHHSMFDVRCSMFDVSPI